ncbi:MAG: septum formation initiator family protein [Lachnospiraceae bacterium]|nr:septum formation initiator family protein [Lachnospiraceae bacterium]
MTKRRIRVRKKRQNRLAMILVTMVVVVMMLVVAVNNRQLKTKLASYQEREKILTEQIENEKKRAEEILEFEKYTKTKKYIEEVAREKLGLVYEDEILIQSDNQ